ncbi:DUF2845 domain-containing protein [Pseudorhodoferax sp.]|uniref:DUF2845 domain-containing protein n=1 Tax=Pseudorhodoferax sp. TaxID=1993553 RepID=UPI002DD641A0|nr:DUF2845 domain-containing protein [Pseudorhodoferax sp.]
MWKLAILACVLLSWGGQAAAQSLRCGRDFAQIGETKFVIESKCGAPAAKDNFCAPIGIAPSTVGRPPHVACDMVEEWTYKPGIGQFITILRFREGELREMKYGPRQ